MKGKVKLFRVAGININIHFTFLLLPLLFGYQYGIKGVFIILFVFCCVTLHELMHSIQAKRFGIKVDQIILLPIGGIAFLKKMPENPKEEFIVSISGPLFNIGVAIVFFYPLYYYLGPQIFFRPSLETWPQTIAYAYWINPLLAIFNLLPAFPMDGGRILRSFLAQKMSYIRATHIAVSFGHIFAIFFGFWGLLSQPPNFLFILIAFFIYFAASQEGLQVDIRTTLKHFFVRDILNKNFSTVSPETTISETLGIIFHSHQEDFPVVKDNNLVGFLSRSDIISCIHQHGMERLVQDVMHKEFPLASPDEPLSGVYSKLEGWGLKAIPVVKDSELVGLITLEDISRVYLMISGKA